MPPSDKPSEKAEAFIDRWQGQEGGQERANYALFLTELCDVLDLPHPDVARDPRRNDYVFERVVSAIAMMATRPAALICTSDSFVLEAKQSRWKGGRKKSPGRMIYFLAEIEDRRNAASAAQTAPGTC